MVLCPPVDNTPTPDLWKAVRGILEEALALPEADRPAFVKKAANGDPVILAELESLLANSQTTSTWIDNTIAIPLEEALELPPGHRLAQYEIVEKLGSGGMGIVYLARDLRLDRLAALKLLASPIETQDERRRFAREARAASALNHPAIVTIYEYSSDNGLDFIAMEYVRGITLADRLKQDPPLPELLEIARQTAVAVSRAHSAGIFHRDLKPANIMITADGAVKVLDFGIATQSKASSDLVSDHRSILGTPAYMAPEVALGDVADHRADIFAFGVILYEMATRKRPFLGTDAPGTLAKIQHYNPPRADSVNPKVSAELADLIEKCLRKEKKERLDSMSEIAAALGTITAPRADPSRRWLIAGLSALLAGAATYGILQSIPEPSAPAITYSIEAQKGENELPYTAAPTDIFKAGWKFRLRLHAARPGHFYVLTEAPKEIAVVFPYAGAQSPPVAASVTGWYVFDNNPGLETLWAIWSEQPLTLLSVSGIADPSRAASIRELLTKLPTHPSGIAGERIQLQHQ